MQGTDDGGNREWMTAATRKERAVEKARKGRTKPWATIFIPQRKANRRIRRRGK
jgi:hypothetical protein